MSGLYLISPASPARTGKGFVSLLIEVKCPTKRLVAQARVNNNIKTYLTVHSQSAIFGTNALRNENKTPAWSELTVRYHASAQNVESAYREVLHKIGAIFGGSEGSPFDFVYTILGGNGNLGEKGLSLIGAPSVLFIPYYWPLIGSPHTMVKGIDKLHDDLDCDCVCRQDDPSTSDYKNRLDLQDVYEAEHKRIRSQEYSAEEELKIIEEGEEEQKRYREFLNDSNKKAQKELNKQQFRERN